MGQAIVFCGLSISIRKTMQAYRDAGCCTALADWATPLAGLNVRPTHISAKDYYSLAVENLRTYMVYFPGREPKDYWQIAGHRAEAVDGGRKIT